MKYAMWILWPSFLVGAAAEGVFFSLFDPADLHVFGHGVDWSRTAVYTVGFFAFWLFAAASSALTCWLQSGSHEAERE